MKRFEIVFLFSTLFLGVLGSSISSLFANTQQGTGTYYGPTTGGNCGYSTLIPSFVSSLTQVAINSPDYSGTDQSQGCGMCVQIQATGSGSGANPISTTPFIAFVQDQCPSCSPGGIDLAVNGDGAWGIEWKAVPCPVGDYKIHYQFQGSNDWYLKFQILGSCIPVTSVTLVIDGKEYGTTRTQDNFWNPVSGAPTPFKFPLSVILTAYNGDTLEDQISDMGSNLVAISGTGVQFSGCGSTSPPPPHIPTPTPTPTSVPKPTPTPKPKPKPTPTPTPTPTSVPKPTPTSKPKPTPTPTPVASHTTSCTLYGTGNGPTNPFDNWSYPSGSLPSFSGGSVVLPITSSWNALYLTCPSATNCITVTTSTSLTFKAYGGSGSGGNQIIQVIPVVSGNSKNGVQVTLTEGVTSTYTLTASQLGITSSVTGFSGVQFQAFSSQVHQSQVTLSNIIFENAGCGQNEEDLQELEKATMNNYNQTTVMSVSNMDGISMGAWIGIGVGLSVVVMVVVLVILIAITKAINKSAEVM